MINSVKDNYGSCRERRDLSNPSFAFCAVGGEYLAHNESRKGEVEEGSQLCCLFLHEALSPLWEHLWSAGNPARKKSHGAGQGGSSGRDLTHDWNRSWMSMETRIYPQWSQLTLAPHGKKILMLGRGFLLQKAT